MPAAYIWIILISFAIGQNVMALSESITIQEGGKCDPMDNSSGHGDGCKTVSIAGDLPISPVSTPGDLPSSPVSTPGDPPTSPVSTPGDLPSLFVSTPGDLISSPVSNPGDLLSSPVSTPGDLLSSPVSTPDDLPSSPVSTPGDLPRSPVSTPGDVPTSSVSTIDDLPTLSLSTHGDLPTLFVSTPVSNEESSDKNNEEFSNSAIQEDIRESQTIHKKQKFATKQGNIGMEFKQKLYNNNNNNKNIIVTESFTKSNKLTTSITTTTTTTSTTSTTTYSSNNEYCLVDGDKVTILGTDNSDLSKCIDYLQLINADKKTYQSLIIKRFKDLDLHDDVLKDLLFQDIKIILSEINNVHENFLELSNATSILFADTSLETIPKIRSTTLQNFTIRFSDTEEVLPLVNPDTFKLTPELKRLTIAGTNNCTIGRGLFVPLTKLQFLDIIQFNEIHLMFGSFQFTSPDLKLVNVDGILHPVTGSISGFPSKSKLWATTADFRPEVLFNFFSGGALFWDRFGYDGECNCDMAWIKYSPFIRSSEITCREPNTTDRTDLKDANIEFCPFHLSLNKLP